MPDPISTPAQMREAAARLIDDRCADILSKQDGKIPEVDQGLRLMAVFLPDLAAAIRALPVAEPERPAEGLLRGAREALAMAQAGEPQAVRVKPLVAGRHPRGFIATDHGGGAAYIFALNGGRYECIKGLAHSPRFDTSKEALAAAQADHAARVLSQIDAVPAAQVRAEALREAAALPPYDGDGDPAGSFDHHVFVKRDAIRALIEKEPT